MVSTWSKKVRKNQEKPGNPFTYQRKPEKVSYFLEISEKNQDVYLPSASVLCYVS